MAMSFIGERSKRLTWKLYNRAMANERMNRILAKPVMLTWEQRAERRIAEIERKLQALASEEEER